MRKLFYLFFLLSFFSCKDENKDQKTHALRAEPLEVPVVLTPGKDTFKLPTIILAGAPIINKVQPPIVSSSLADNPNTPQGIPHFSNFTTKDGLALDAIAYSILDKMGNLWFGSHGGGVSRYDGKTFTNYTTAQGLANNTVFSITEDEMGNLWFGTYGGGVSRYDGKTFTNYTTAKGSQIM
ncbi:MAG: hypothetical protein IPH32_00995 [Bacteroidetes bacterium]|nr:hypothetical protein [Bacteroidota bacterium]